MKTSPEGYRVAVVGASSLLGKELLNVLGERHFPFSRLVSFSDEEDEPELPILDLDEGPPITVPDENVTASDLDFVFIAARYRKMPAFLSPASSSQGPPPCFVIDLSTGALAEETPETPLQRRIVRVPFLDHSFPISETAEGGAGKFYVGARPAAIIISTLLLRLGARFRLTRAVAHVFASVSEIGSRGIDELQKQTVNLLSFQKIPRKVFGTQLAFNLLSRPSGTSRGELLVLENGLRRQLQDYLHGRVPLPALRLLQVPVFHSLAVSLYVETDPPTAPEKAGVALMGERIDLRRPTHDSPTPVEAAGSDDILVDSATPDPDHPGGLWIWAVADNLRLAAVNAVEIAESLRQRAG
ncbi:MAG: Asd/ArgC dimerization domain-containing protein [Terriglobia bacterium]|jgi:aspartate-semialdehyde dehydrogenase